MDTYESRRYKSVENFRTEEVEHSYHYKRNPLFKQRQPWEQDEGFGYTEASLKGIQGKTVDEALAAYRERFNVPQPGVHPRLKPR